MATSACGPVGSVEAAGLFAPWVEWRQELGRNGRCLITAVNHRDGEGFYVDAAELSTSHPRRGAVVAELGAGGFLVDGCRRRGAVDDSSRVEAGLVWRGVDRFVRRLHGRGGHRLFRPLWLAAQVALAAVGVVALVRTVTAGPVEFHAEPAQVPAIIVLGLVAVFIHELGHALVTVHYGRHVRLAGVRLHLGAPAFYVESVDALLLTRRQRLIQAAAGPWAEWLVTVAVAVVALSLDGDGGVAAILQRFVVINTIGIASNLLPFVGLDGALLLADAIRRPDLPFQAQTALARSGSAGRWIVVYSILNAVVAGGLLVMSGFFWWQLFGGLTSMLWGFGPVGAAAVVLFYTLLVRDLWSMFSRAVAQGRTHMLLMWSKLMFRFERRWRVEAISAFRTLPELATLGPAELGIIAGRLQRHCGRSVTLPIPSSHAYIRRGPSITGANGSATHQRIVAAGDETMRVALSAARDLVLLPTEWRSYLGPVCSSP